MPKFRITYLLIAVCVAVFLLELFGNADFIINEYGFSTNSLFTKPWTLVTGIFLHGGLAHLLSNMIILLFVGIAVEEELGKGRTLLIFFLGAFAGDLLSTFFYAPDVVSIGASAGIFALVGVGMIVRPLEISVSTSMIPMPLILLGLLYTVYNVIGFFTDVGSNISYIAHFGGLAVGLAFGLKYKGWKRVTLLIILIIAILLLIPVILSVIGPRLF